MPRKKATTPLPAIMLLTFSIFSLILASIGIYLILLSLKNLHRNMGIEYRRPVLQRLPEDVNNNLKAQSSPNITYHIPILLYHYIEYVTDKRDTIRQSLVVIPSVFEQQVKTLKDAGYTFITSADYGSILNGKGTLPEKPVIITIDDGHWDLATDILPILKKYNVKATAYIVPGLLGGSDYLSQSQLQEVINSKLVDIGAHTVHHMWLKGRSKEFVQKEVLDSKTMLEQKFNIHVVSFAYPYGGFDQNTIDIVKAANFSTASTTIAGNVQSEQNRFFLYRIRPGYKTGKALLDYVNQATYSAIPNPSPSPSPQK